MCDANLTSMNRRPAACLAGRTLTNGWKVEGIVPHSQNSTGGHFSVSYFVRSAVGKRAFLKAMDFTSALRTKDPSKNLESLTASYNFEGSLLDRCAEGKLSRIIRILDKGMERIDENDEYTAVQYMIFELAQRDVRSCLETSDVRDVSWILLLMHQATAAVRQLHSVRIAHQDIKPSNLLLFWDRHAKLADLGRASARNRPSGHDDLAIAGDQSYAPPELLYGHLLSDWQSRRLGSDMYLLGSLFVVLLMQVPMTQILLKRMDAQHRPSKWAGSYGEVLPYIQSEFAQLLREIRDKTSHPDVDKLISAIRELCNPDPNKRGNPKARSIADRYTLDRYLTTFDLLYRRSTIR